MAILHQCCFCCDVRKGSIYCGIYCLTTSILFLSLLIIRFYGFKILQQNGPLPGIAFAIIGVFVIKIVCTLLLLIGIHKDLRHLITPWLITTVFSMVLVTCGFIWIIVTSLWEREEISGWDLAISAYHFCNSIILIYCVLCVISQLQDLLRGKGTAEAYRRRRERRRMIQAFAEMHLPLDVELDLFHGGPRAPIDHPVPTMHPPPYSDKPPSYCSNAEAQTSRERNADLSNGSHGNGNTNAALENDMGRGDINNNNNQTSSEQTVRANSEPNDANSVETNQPSLERVEMERSGNSQTSTVESQSERYRTSVSSDIRNTTNTTPPQAPGSSDRQQQPDGKIHNQLHHTSKETRGHGDGKRDLSGNGLRQTRHHSAHYSQPGPSTSTRAEGYHGRQIPNHSGHADGMQSSVARQQYRSNTSAVPNANKHQGKPRKYKRSNDIVLRSYERNDQFNDGIGVRHFEYTTHNREGVYPS